MQSIRSELRIEAPRFLVWDALSDMRTVSEWNPGIDDAECLSEEASGLGARRRCYTHPTGWMTESVSEWEEGTCVAFSVEDATPLKNGVARFVLSDEVYGTRVDARFDYEVKLGPLGPVIDRLIVHRQLVSAWQRGLDGLREYTQDQWNAPDSARARSDNDQKKEKTT
jgi:uncharacterized protein YndB with AHSA1/START domain